METNQEKLNKLNDELLKACFERGRASLELEIIQDRLDRTITNQRNLNNQYTKLQEQYAKELKLAPATVPTSPPILKPVPVMDGDVR